jgi:hypothetical protein
MGYLGFLIGKNGGTFGCKRGIGFQGRDRLGRIRALNGLGFGRYRSGILRAYPGVVGVEPDADRKQTRCDSRRYAGDLAERGREKAEDCGHVVTFGYEYRARMRFGSPCQKSSESSF